MKKLMFVSAILCGSVLMGQAALSWAWSGAAPANPYYSDITAAMNTAVSNYNKYASYSGTIYVTYNSGVPTAQTDGYQGLIEFGASRTARVAEHEMGHWLGCGTYSTWSSHNSSGQWNGPCAKMQLQCFDNAGAILYCDNLHFWPYGWNYDNEGPADRNIAMVGALRQDMGLSNGSLIVDGTYKIISKNSGKAVDVYGAATTNGSAINQWTYASGSNQKWALTSLGGGLYKVIGVQSGRSLDDYNYVTTDGASVVLWDYWSGNTQQWYVLPSAVPGYYCIVNLNSGKALDVSGASTANGAAIIQWSLNGGANQQWIIAAP
jgi:hypothetical protein